MPALVPLTELTADQYAVFPEIAALVTRHAPAALDMLYARINADPVCAKLLPGHELQTAAANAQLEHPALSEGHHLGPLAHDWTRRAGAGDQARHDVTVVEGGHCNVSALKMPAASVKPSFR